jgi:hypothetical protein
VRFQSCRSLGVDTDGKTPVQVPHTALFSLVQFNLQPTNLYLLAGPGLPAPLTVNPAGSQETSFDFDFFNPGDVVHKYDSGLKIIQGNLLAGVPHGLQPPIHCHDGCHDAKDVEDKSRATWARETAGHRALARRPDRPQARCSRLRAAGAC